MDSLCSEGAPETLQSLDMSKVIPPVISVAALMKDSKDASYYGMPRPGAPISSASSAAATLADVADQQAPQPLRAGTSQQGGVSLKPKDPRAAGRAGSVPRQVCTTTG